MTLHARAADAQLAAVAPPSADGVPLERTRQRIERTFRVFGFEITAATGEHTWVSVADAGRPERLAEQVERLTARHAGHRDVAAAYVAMRVASVITGPLMSAYLLERRVPLLDPATASLRTDEALEFERLATGTARFAAPATDAAAGHSDLTVVGSDALTDTLVDTLEHLLQPVLTGLRALAPFGRRGLWGLTADSIGGCALAAARETGTDYRPVWGAATEVLDRLQKRGIPVNNRPRALVVACEGREFPFSIRGTCCLRYKADPRGDHHDPEFGAYCHSCPLVDDDILYRHYLDNARTRLGAPSSGPADQRVPRGITSGVPASGSVMIRQRNP